MEQPPQHLSRPMSYDKALVLALQKSNRAEWRKIQILALEGYLIEKASREPIAGLEVKSFNEAVKNERSLRKLRKVGNEYGMLGDFNLEAESLKIFCRKRNIKLET